MKPPDFFVMEQIIVIEVWLDKRLSIFLQSLEAPIVSRSRSGWMGSLSMGVMAGHVCVCVCVCVGYTCGGETSMIFGNVHPETRKLGFHDPIWRSCVSIGLVQPPTTGSIKYYPMGSMYMYIPTFGWFTDGSYGFWFKWYTFARSRPWPEKSLWLQ